MPFRAIPFRIVLSFIIFVVLISFGCTKNNNGPAIPNSLSVSPAIDTIAGIITITGTNFNTSALKDTVIFNDSIYAVVTAATSTQLTVIVPAWANNGKIKVKANGTIAETKQEFVVAPKFHPQSEGAGYSVTITAAGLSNTLSDNTVLFNGVQAKVVSIFANQLTVLVPTGATNGKLSVSVHGQSTASLIDFTIAPTGTVTTLAGDGTLGANNGAGSTANFFNPAGLTVDPNGNVYVADLNNGLIRKITPDGMVSTYAGNGSFGSSDGLLFSAGFYGPTGITIAKNGDLFVTDQFSGAIRKISGDSVTTIAGVGINGFSFLNPTGILIDPNNNIVLSDSYNMKIKKIETNGQVTTVAGSGMQTWQDGASAIASFDDPDGLIMDLSGNILVADVGNDKIRLINGSGEVGTFAGLLTGYKDDVGIGASFTQPSDIVMDVSGNFYVADGGNQVIRRITADGVVTTIAGNPQQSGDAVGTGASAAFNGPWHLTIDKNGVLYVSDRGNSKIRKIVIH